MEPTKKSITQSQFFPIGLVLAIAPFQWHCAFFPDESFLVFVDEFSSPVVKVLQNTVLVLLHSLYLLGIWGVYLSIRNAQARFGTGGAVNDRIPLIVAFLGIVLNGFWLFFGASLWLLFLASFIHG
jgi:hypothetical protein